MRTFLKLHFLLFLQIVGPSILFITLEDSTSAVVCVVLFVTDACVLAVYIHFLFCISPMERHRGHPYIESTTHTL